MLELVQQYLTLLHREASARKWLVVILFTFTSSAILAAGFFYPKKFVSNTLLYADDQNIIKPLLNKTAVTNKVVNHAKIAREILFGKKVMNKIVLQSRLIDPDASEIDRQKAIEGVIQRTTIKNRGANVLFIEYQDTRPSRAHQITTLLATYFISESNDIKKQQSRDAYNFINKQVKSYHEQLIRAEENLKEFKSERVNDGTESTVNARIANLRQQIEQTQLQLRQANIEKASINSQLNEETEVTESLEKDSGLRARLEQLEDRLAILKLSYLDTYPDVVAVKYQIEDTKAAIEDEARKRKEARENASKSNAGSEQKNKGSQLNPLYQTLRENLASVKTTIKTLEEKKDALNELLEQEYERAERVHSGLAQLAELTRDYEVTKTIYDDLLQKREKARVSMNLALEGQGLSFKIQEPATKPLKPKGLRFLHFYIGSFIVGLLVPVGVLLLLIQFDEKVRLRSQIEELEVEVLGVIPKYKTRKEQKFWRSGWMLLGLVILVDIAVYIAITVLKLLGYF